MADAAALPSPATPAPIQQPAEPPDLAKLKRMFDEARDGMQDARRLSEACRDYYDGKQLTAAQRRVLRLRKQPDVVINRTRRAIDGTLGVIEQGKTDPRAYMRNPPQQKPQAPQAQQMMPPQLQMGANGGPPMPGAQPAPPPEPDLDASDVATMTLRYVADRSQFQRIKIDVLEYMLVEGTAGAITEWDAEAREITIELIAADEYFYDPRSRRPDFSDKRYDGIAKWMYADDVAARYPNAKAEIEATVTTGDAGLAADSSWADKPERGGKPWVDRRQRRLMVVEMYYKEGGVWNRAVFTGGGILEVGPSTYVDDKGRPRNPIEAQSTYIDRDLMRYGFVRDMIDIQDEINARRSKAIHEINTRQVQQSDPNAPPVDVETVRAEAARPDGVIPTGWSVVPRNDVVANSIAMLQEAKSELERLAPNPAILGRQGADASGRAQQLRAQAGLVELARPLGRFTDWEHRIYAQQIWPCARQFYTDPMWVRVSGDDGAPQYVRINDPVTEPVVNPMTGQPLTDPMTGKPAMRPKIDPQTGQPVVKNHIALMDLDIVVDNVPDTATLEQEIWADLVQLAQTYGPQAVPFEVMVEMSPLPNKYRLKKMLKQAQAEAAQAAAPAIALKTADAQAKIGKTQSETAKNTADAKATEIDAVKTAMEGHMLAVGHPGPVQGAGVPQIPAPLPPNPYGGPPMGQA